MNNKYIENISPFIFSKKINDKYNVIPLNITDNTSGPTKHFPVATKEWYNCIYTYNNNSIKNLSVADKNLTKLIKSYFNLYLSNKISKSQRISTIFKRLTVNKVFISRAELKHTSSKVFITLHVYNQERIALLRKIKMFENLLFPSLKSLSYKEKSPKPLSLKEKLNIIKNEKNNTSLISWLERLQLSIIELIKLENKIILTTKSLKLKSNKLLIIENLEKNLKALLDIIAICENDSISYKHYEKIYAEFLHKTHLEREIITIAYYKLLLNLNKFKFEDKFLLKLKPLISKIYNKQVEFNIINLKTLYLNSDIFTQVIALKLKNRKNKLLKVLRSSLYMVKLPKVNRIRENYYKLNVKELWVNKVKNLKIDSESFGFYNQKKGKVLINNSNEDLLNQVLLYLFPSSSFITRYVEKSPNIYENRTSKNILNLILNTIKYKEMAGARLEAKGRLTKRFTASRSVFKIKWKGSLKNIDSSYRGLSSVMLRGHFKSNLQYSMINSKTRNGAFGLKGWISSK